MSAAEIAAKLTKAQKAFVLAVPTDVRETAHWWNIRSNWAQHSRSWRALLRRGKLVDAFGNLRGLGLAVRTELERSNER